ncbi:MAG: hypothetical protein KDK30_15835 [Leptospiraceae bacterium]|nr:hypothetical protein [Leptospiraceae bacterium]MCB1317457.1 hypothetical protein [Leptospiraceae bacterium]MCB1321414.1 hypothetical protein [Leptospiraceae bacterium]
MADEKRKIKRTVVLELYRQNQIMREILDDWPAREIMMDFEKEWNERREEFLNNHPIPELDL